MKKEDKFLKKLEQRYPQLQKSFFAKYLPVEGEIKIGSNLVIFKGTNKGCYQLETEEKLKIFMNLPGVKEKGARMGKLFLCSRDIQIGDEITWIGTGKSPQTPFGTKMKHDTLLTVGIMHENWVKVIGEVSEKAKFVKEGDEFQGEGVDFVIAVSDEDYEKPAQEQKPFYMIKCKCCGHFH